MEAIAWPVPQIARPPNIFISVFGDRHPGAREPP